MLVKPKECTGCPLHTLGAGFARTRGLGETGVLVVAEALGEHEAREGRPLVGPAGGTWDRIIARTRDAERGIQLDSNRDFLHANVINCRPPDNLLTKQPYEHGAIAHCSPYLDATIRDFKPRAIVALGNTALRRLTGEYGIEQLRGYIFPTRYGPVIPTYHPSYIMRGKWNLARVVQLDVSRAIEVARKGTAHFLRDKTYVLSPSWREVHDFVEEWRSAGKPPLAFDIETPRDDEAAEHEEMVFEEAASYTILMISLAFKPYHAISIPWQEPFVTLLKEVLLEAPTTLVWNAAFDVPRLIANGVHFGGEIIDDMLAWHWLEPALPMGLKWVATICCPDMPPWKLQMHQNFQWYNAADSDVLLRCHLEIQKGLEAQGRWKTFLRHFVHYGKLLNRMTERGVSIDHARRAEARDYFTGRFAEAAASADAMAPPGVKRLHPKRGYKKQPASTEGLVQIQVTLTPAEEEQERKRAERNRKKLQEAREKAERKAAREAARRAKEAAREGRRAARAARKQQKVS